MRCSKMVTTDDEFLGEHLANNLAVSVKIGEEQCKVSVRWVGGYTMSLSSTSRIGALVVYHMIMDGVTVEALDEAGFVANKT